MMVVPMPMRRRRHVTYLCIDKAPAPDALSGEILSVSPFQHSNAISKFEPCYLSALIQIYTQLIASLLLSPKPSFELRTEFPVASKKTALHRHATPKTNNTPSDFNDYWAMSSSGEAIMEWESGNNISTTTKEMASVNLLLLWWHGKAIHYASISTYIPYIPSISLVLFIYINW